MNGIGTMFIFIAQQCTGDYLRAVPGSRVKLSVSDYKADVATGMLFHYSDLPLLFFFYFIIIFLLSTELGVTGVIQVKVGRGRSDGARLSAAVTVAAAAARSRQHRHGSQARANLYSTRRQR